MLLLSSACAQGTGVAGVATKPPETPPVASPSVTATIPETTATTVPTSEHQAGAIKPPAEEPVKVPPPKLSKYSYVFPVKGCSTSYQKRLLVLPKTTIWAGRGCAFVSPVDGVVDEVNLQNRWKPSVDAGATREGRFVTIIGEDGVRYLGGHLDTIDEGVRPGVKVKAGQRLGTVGNTGNARDTAPNLYFAISWKTGPAYWWVRRGMVNPWNYLDAWREGNATFSPRHETFELRGKVGETPGCTVQCSAKKPSKKAEREEEPPRPQPTPEPTAQPTTFPA
ncbi:M23 family metallopeptidase [Nonomuraea soli]|uniref:Murein DD-endopeptidase MepM/ murein hydrolase activator NlpD n=1 Tax=Nonomuraea soli TaxID=1032476 RepID=A0A7W0CDV9_9ACTN|nr:peptidoglycan DD-metalloendopeptidase family protein [Nonomuraea soli]MBA2889190.1 murein DD-endopeptidase MepM/ murein hydrolase activator NlpD [Nonomuraea soli]